MELRLPEEGLEVVASDQRRSQPGLIVVAGPQVVSPEDKLRGPEPTIWNSGPIQRDDATSEPKSTQKNDVAPESDKKIWGLRRRAFHILVAVTFLALAGVVIGVAVAVTQQKMTRTTSLSTSGGGQVSSSSLSMPPPIVTETVAPYVTSDPSTFATLLKTEIPLSSPQASKTTIMTTTAGRGSGGSEPANVATVFVTELLSPTDTIRSQPMITISSAPSPPKPTTPPVPPVPPAPSSPPAPSPTSSSPSSRICIGDDGSTYTDPGTGDKFRLEVSILESLIPQFDVSWGRDLPNREFSVLVLLLQVPETPTHLYLAHEGKDIENLEAETMQACVSLCAKNTHCKGAIWYNVGPQGTDLNYCWLKSEMDDNDIRVTPDAQSVVRL
ncbi:hypothetical protein EKO27_g2216 [Xylaria grammica]|uniref:Apple domain-containing protein n=1 Tax=Xylaria grammica TaxID=363999 RepID=A0A439DEU0_9PEZI|nr:hypothetical protein EKO27_g2216 [Xylaria grammica]